MTNWINMTSISNFAKSCICLMLAGALNLAAADKVPDKTLPVRGFCISSPSGNRVDEFNLHLVGKAG